MEVTQNGSRPSARGPAECFTGAVGVDPPVQAPDPAPVTAASVTFEPGARSFRDGRERRMTEERG
jgi:hypothetical protein